MSYNRLAWVGVGPPTCRRGPHGRSDVAQRSRSGPVRHGGRPTLTMSLSSKTHLTPVKLVFPLEGGPWSSLDGKFGDGSLVGTVEYNGHPSKFNTGNGYASHLDVDARVRRVVVGEAAFAGVPRALLVASHLQCRPPA